MKKHATTISLMLLIIMTCSLVPATLARNGIYQTTLKVWESMAKGSPNKRRPHQNYGQALSTAGFYQEALHEFDAVLALPDDGSVPLRDLYREIGVVRFRLGLYDEAIVAWQKGLQYAPYDPGLLNNLAIALMKQKRYDEALNFAQTAARMNPSMPEPLNTLGELYLTKGEPRKAVEQFMRFLQLRPEDSRGYWNTALAMREAGDYRGALQYAQLFLAREPDPYYRKIAADLVNNINARMNASQR
ncbi:MAG: tetratricopeptide repeat protein [Nitrospirota bacterium]